MDGAKVLLGHASPAKKEKRFFMLCELILYKEALLSAVKACHQ